MSWNLRNDVVAFPVSLLHVCPLDIHTLETIGRLWAEKKKVRMDGSQKGRKKKRWKEGRKVERERKERRKKWHGDSYRVEKWLERL